MSRILLKELLKYPICTKIKNGKIFQPSTCFVRYSSFETQPYILCRLDSGPSTRVSCDKESALKFYKEMSIIRKCQQVAEKMYREKLIRGFLHLYSGQEATCVGMKASMKASDHVITAYRCHGWAYMMGISILEILAELTGRSTGASRGKGGSMHMFTKHFYGGNGIVGSHIPVGAGVAFAQKYQGKDAICVVLYGDGAANQGQTYESYNMAKLWDIPAVFVCENNLYGMGTPVTRASANTNFHDRGLNTIPGIKADGMDVLCMRQVMQFAREYALQKGPIIVESVTYRYFGHSMSDPGYSYRKREEIQDVRNTRDPIRTFKDKILRASIVSDADLKTIDDEVNKIVNSASKQAAVDKEVDEKEVAYDMYAQYIGGLVRNNLPWTGYEHKNTRKAYHIE